MIHPGVVAAAHQWGCAEEAAQPESRGVDAICTDKSHAGVAYSKGSPPEGAPKRGFAGVRESRANSLHSPVRRASHCLERCWAKISPALS